MCQADVNTCSGAVRHQSPSSFRLHSKEPKSIPGEMAQAGKGYGRMVAQWPWWLREGCGAMLDLCSWCDHAVPNRCWHVALLWAWSYPTMP